MYKKLFIVLLVLFTSKTITFSQPFYPCVCTGTALCDFYYNKISFTMSYQAINDTMYKVRLIVIARCDGIGLDSQDVFYYTVGFDTCNYKMYQWPLPVTKLNNPLHKIKFLPDGRPNHSLIKLKYCKNFPTTCDTPYNSNNIIGFKEHWYEDTIILPEKCGKWTFTITEGVRDTTTTNIKHIAIYNNIYLNSSYLSYNNFNMESELNNNNLKNNSVLITNNAPVYICENMPFIYNPGYIDPDGDSISVTLMNTRRHRIICDASALVFLNNPTYSYLGQLWDTIPFAPPYSLAEPFNTNHTFVFDTLTGSMSFTPAPNQNVLLTTKVDEYRKGVWVGSTMRDFSFVTIPCTNTPNEAHLDINSLVNFKKISNTSLLACINKPASACIYLTNANAQSLLTATSNITSAIPNSSITFTQISGDSIKACISWLPTATAIGNHPFTISVTDTSCTSQGASVPYHFGFNLILQSAPSLTSNYKICTGDSILLNPTLSNIYTFYWANASGVNNFNCSTSTACPTITAKPATSDKYYLTAMTTGGGCTYYDTANVFVINNFTVKAPNLLVCGSQSTTTLACTIANSNTPLTFNWLPTTGIIGSSTANPITITTNTTKYYVTVTDSANCFTHIDTAKIIYDAQFNPTASSNKNSICSGDTIVLTAVGGTVVWQPNYAIANINNAITKAYPDTSVIYNATIASTQSNCTAKINIPIKAILLKADLINDTTIYDGETVRLGGPNMLCDDCLFFWYDSRDFLASNVMNHSLNPLVRPPGDTYFRIRLVSKDGACFDQDSVFIKVLCNGAFVPNAFSPNSATGLESIRKFGAHNSGLKNFTLTVYNRLGQEVFRSNDCNARWDGTFKGLPCAMDTYFWHLVGDCDNGTTVDKNGDVILIR